jgi:teichuronic acid biosynthesis glycosyltransferase TuaH
MRWLGGDDIHIADTPEAYVRRVDELLARPRTGEDVERRQRFAARHSWSDRTDRLADALELAPAPTVPAPAHEMDEVAP